MLWGWAWAELSPLWMLLLDHRAFTLGGGHAMNSLRTETMSSTCYLQFSTQV